MKTKREYSKIQLGTNDGQRIYLTPPKWDCGWYWSFGYLGNKNCHYHLNGIGNFRQNLKDAIDEHFGQSFIIRPSKRWEFAELCQSAYKLKETAEIFGRGGSYLSSNPCCEVIKDASKTEQINREILPEIFDAIYQIIEADLQTSVRSAEIEAVNLEGDSQKLLEIMSDLGYTPDDYEFIGLSELDRDRMHGMYWKNFHQNKKAESANNEPQKTQ